MQMRKRETSPCRVSCHLSDEAVAVGAGGVAGPGDDVAGAALVADESEGCTGQVWDYQEGPNKC